MPDADKEDALIVAVMRDGKVFFGTDQIQADQLTGRVKDRLANRVDKRFICAQMRAPSTAASSKSWITSAPPAWTSSAC